MNKLLILLLITSLQLQAKSQQPLVWNNNKLLSWADFKGTIPAGAVSQAQTATRLTVDFSFKNQAFLHTISCVFIPQNSWVKTRDSALLVHEQLHFDIAELHARILHKTLKAYKINKKTMQQDLNRIYDSVMKNMGEYQLRYDKETNHSMQKEQQLMWESKVEKELQALEAFADYNKK